MSIMDLLQKEKSQDIVSEGNMVFGHIMRYRVLYLLLLALLLFSIPPLQNSILHKPLLFGGESYYHLTRAENLQGRSWHYFPLALVIAFLPKGALTALPMVLALLSLGLFFILSKRWGWPDRMTLIFGILVILSPAFIYTYTTLSLYSYVLFLFLLGLVMLTSPRSSPKLLAAIPFFLITFTDLLNVILLFVAAWYLWYKSGDKWLSRVMVTFVFIFIIQWLVLQTPFILGPFHAQNKSADLIADLGGLHGIGFFLITLSIIGMVWCWKQERVAYLFALILVGGFLLTSQILFPLLLVLAYFAALAVIRLFDRHWILDSLKRFTFLLLILGVLFSTMTYLEREKYILPTAADEEALTWLGEHSTEGARVFSYPENSYFISYFSHQPALEYPHQRSAELGNVTLSIIHSSYITDLFPLLENYNISYIYITPAMRNQLPSDGGLLFLLKNERFKLVHSSGRNEVWMYNRGPLSEEPLKKG